MSLYEKLTPRNKAILDNYLAGDTGTEAYRKVCPRNKSPRSGWYNFFKREDIKAAYEERAAEIFAGTEVTRQMIIREFARIAFGNIKSLFNEAGQLRPLHELNDDEAALIAGFDVEALYDGVGRDRTRIGDVLKIKANDKNRALEGLARIGGMNKDKAELSGNVNLTPPIVQFARYPDDNNDQTDQSSG